MLSHKVVFGSQATILSHRRRDFLLLISQVPVRASLQMSSSLHRVNRINTLVPCGSSEKQGAAQCHP